MVAHLVWDQRAAGSNPVIPTIVFGSIAQLGERLPYKQDVTGSSPVTPTTLWAAIFAGVAQLVEQLICNQQVAGSSPITSSTNGQAWLVLHMGEFPSGQRGQTVNLLRLASMVRIHPLPPKNDLLRQVVFSLKYCKRNSAVIYWSSENRRPIRKGAVYVCIRII